MTGRIEIEFDENDFYAGYKGWRANVTDDEGKTTWFASSDIVTAISASLQWLGGDITIARKR